MKTVTSTGRKTAKTDNPSINKPLDSLAEQVKDQLGELGMNGDRPGKARGLADKILSSKTTSEKRTAADQLAALLKNGNGPAQKLATEIENLPLDNKPATPPGKGKGAVPSVPTIPGAVPRVKAAGAASPEAAKPATSVSPATEPAPVESGNQSGEQNGQDDAGQGEQNPAEESPYEEADLRPVKVEDIKTAEPFKSLFPALVDKVAKLTEDMKARGYDQAHPVVIWEEKKILLDGHCRVRAAGEAGIETIPAVFQSFGTEEAAFQYAVRTQCARRNLTDGDIVSLVQQIDKRYPRGGNNKPGRKPKDAIAPTGAFGRSSKETGEKIGYSYRTVDRVRKLIKANNASLLQEVVNGTLSLGEALKRLPKGHRNVDPEVAAARARAKVRRLLESAKEVMESHNDEFSDMVNKLDELLSDLES